MLVLRTLQVLEPITLELKKFGLILGPIVFLILFFLPYELLNPEADRVISVAAWMVIWWITECVSISITALIPLVIFPLVGIMDIKEVGPIYGSHIVWLFFGGFVMALALEKVNLHKRIALSIVKITGTTPDRIVLGFMLATAFLSMWISNTATTVVMLPIALSVISLLKNDDDGFTNQDRKFALSLMLGIAFSANVGGVATIIGTPPNMVMIGFLEETYGSDISFAKWMMIGVPFSLLMLTIIYLVLVKLIYPSGLMARQDSAELIQNELNKLGSLQATEIRVLIIFITTMLLWIFRAKINSLTDAIVLSDAGISMLAAFTLFAIPFKFIKGDFILTWKDTQKLPWGILILFGGGLALAKGLAVSGVIEFIGDTISQGNFSVLLVGTLLIIVLLFMTELMSNVALVSIFCPVVAGIAIGLDVEMLYLLIPVTMAASCAFMLPMATPPNAIVFASGYVKVHEMLKAGVILNVVAIILVVIFMKFFIPLVF